MVDKLVQAQFCCSLSWKKKPTRETQAEQHADTTILSLSGYKTLSGGDLVAHVHVNE